LKEKDAWPVTKPFPAQFTFLRCNQGGKYRQGHKIRATLKEDYVTKKQRYNTAKDCGCKFLIKTINPTNKDKDIEVCFLHHVKFVHNITMYIWSIVFHFITYTFFG